MKKRGKSVMHDRKANYFLRTLAVVAAAIALTTLVAALWQKAEDSKYGEGDTRNYELPKELMGFAETLKGIFGGEKSASEAETSSSKQQVESVSSSSVAESESSLPESSSEPEPEKKPVSFGSVPESEPVDETYFDDAVFIGDSLTEGIKAYELMQNATVLAHQGINVDSILTKEAISSGGGRITIPDALMRLDRVGKIYVMIGANGIAWMDNATFIKKYGAFIDELRDCQPGAVIYVQSMLPVNEQIIIDQAQYEPITNSSIDDLNSRLAKLAEEKGVYYVDVAAAFKDATGGMPAEATPDGIHLNAPYYQTWFDYLMAHTVPEDIGG